MTATPTPTPRSAAGPRLETQLTTRSMGGGLRLVVASAPEDADQATRDVRRVAGRIDAWARRLTRFSTTSDLDLLNRDPARSPVAVRPTLASVLSHACVMSRATEGIVDVSMLDARLAVEADVPPEPADQNTWRLSGAGRRCTVVRSGRVRFDLDGVAKGWIADRALRLLDAYPSALVDADGDVAVRPGLADWSIAVAHPTDDLVDLAHVRAPRGWLGASFGVATSGTSVHRWHGGQKPRHHLIDPTTRRPAVTDVVQATVVAASTGLAEALAKSAIVRGSHEGLGLLERGGAWAALLLTEDDEVLAMPGTTRWLA